MIQLITGNRTEIKPDKCEFKINDEIKYFKWLKKDEFYSYQ